MLLIAKTTQHIPQLHLFVEVCNHLVSKCFELGNLFLSLGLVQAVVGPSSISCHLLLQTANLTSQLTCWESKIHIGSFIIFSHFQNMKYLVVICYTLLKFESGVLSKLILPTFRSEVKEITIIYSPIIDWYCDTWYDTSRTFFRTCKQKNKPDKNDYYDWDLGPCFTLFDIFLALSA